MGNLKEYKYELLKFFEECGLKSVVFDTQDDNLWLATFETKSGQTRQYKTNRQTMLAFCAKFFRDCTRFEDKAILVHAWKRYAMKLYSREYKLNCLLKKTRTKGIIIMGYYEGKQPCAGCGRTGEEEPRAKKDGLCHECSEAIKLGRMMIQERDLKRTYYSLDEFMATHMTWYTIPIPEIDRAVRNLLKQFSQFDRNHVCGRYDKSDKPASFEMICGKMDAITARDTFILPVAVYEAAKELCTTILEAAKQLKEEKRNYRKELDEELAAQKNEIYNEGVAHGRNILNQLNSGEIAAKDIDAFIKKF